VEIRTHKDLDAWKKSMELVTNIYTIIKTFPNEELFGLTSQIKRSAISIPSNIAEGASRTSQVEFKRFLNIAQGSASELETQLIISQNLGFISDIKILQEINVIKKLISGLIRHLNQKTNQLKPKSNNH